MTVSEGPVSVEVLVERIENLIRAVAAVQTTLSDQASAFVPRTEWLLRNDQVDREFKSKGSEIAALRTEFRSSRQPWPVWVAAGGSIVAVAKSFGAF